MEGVVIPRSQVPKDHQGIPRLEGEGNYNPMSDNEVGIRMDNGHLLTMFTQYLQVVE